MNGFSLPVAETRYLMTSEDLRSLLEAEFGRGLDFNIMVNPSLICYICMIPMRFCQHIRGRWTYQAPRELPIVRKASVMV